MNLSLDYLERCSAEAGYQVSPLEKTVRLGEIASEIGRHSFLGEVLALKGGTALNLCFGPPQRLSVDLDFNYIGHVEREKMLADRPRVENTLVDIAGRLGYRVQQSADAFAGRKLFLTYRSLLGHNERIEVDLNFLFRVSLGDTEFRHLWQPGELDRPAVRTVGSEELIAGKLLALFDRAAVRDAWDITHLPGHLARIVDSQAFRARFIAMSVTLEHPLNTYSRSRFEKLVTERVITEQLLPMLVRGIRVEANHLVEQTWQTAGKFVRLAAAEEEFVSAVYRGELLPQLLFPHDQVECDRIGRHPAILWKVANVRTYRERNG